MARNNPTQQSRQERLLSRTKVSRTLNRLHREELEEEFWDLKQRGLIPDGLTHAAWLQLQQED